MNVCVICEADGVLEAVGAWFCIDHLEAGLVEVAMFVARQRGWEVDGVCAQLWEWLES